MNKNEVMSRQEVAHNDEHKKPVIEQMKDQAQAYNRFLPREYLDKLDDWQLLSYCHPNYRPFFEKHLHGIRL